MKIRVATEMDIPIADKAAASVATTSTTTRPLCFIPRSSIQDPRR